MEFAEQCDCDFGDTDYCDDCQEWVADCGCWQWADDDEELTVA